VARPPALDMPFRGLVEAVDEVMRRLGRAPGTSSA
jgi:hypothetical protein